MNGPIATIERPTADSFRAENYLALNPDVAKAVRTEAAARTHFDRYGASEGRKQLSRAFTDTRTLRARDKFRHFRDVLDERAGAGGRFRRANSWRAPLPLTYGGASYSLEQYDGESANAGLHWFNEELEANPQGRYLDLGCGFRSLVYENCLYVDVYPSVTADIVMEPACIYPFADRAFDGISCLAVLEHVKEPWVVAREMHRILKPGGKVYIDWPFLQPVHGYPSHYFNATREGLASLFRQDFDLIELDTLPNQTPDHTLSWIMRAFSDAITDPVLRERFLDSSLRDLLASAPGEGLWADAVAALPADTRMGLACGNTLVARKRA